MKLAAGSWAWEQAAGGACQAARGTTSRAPPLTPPLTPRTVSVVGALLDWVAERVPSLVEHRGRVRRPRVLALVGVDQAAAGNEQQDEADSEGAGWGAGRCTGSVPIT